MDYEVQVITKQKRHCEMWHTVEVLNTTEADARQTAIRTARAYDPDAQKAKIQSIKTIQL
jgi:hypothetical protein